MSSRDCMSLYIENLQTDGPAFLILSSLNPLILMNVTVLAVLKSNYANRAGN